MEDGLSSFWGPVTSIDWCEKNYVHSSYLAELFNTVSNIPGILLALIGLVNSLSRHFEKRFSVLHISNIILAIGSMLYHATLQQVCIQTDGSDPAKAVHSSRSFQQLFLLAYQNLTLLQRNLINFSITSLTSGVNCSLLIKAH
ncbi:alkaline ceramidase isoform X4 [Eucalyptus grandis]|uniref:alkaline ceramidase isoform X4 n=1 Tax=Eucalyptus grandis TaxID=71139 RepID=UPI00192ECD66|nr:alkaline ceramidase isoform X4 [Eucalyptus grandis]